MHVTRDAKIESAAEISTEFEGVITGEFCRITDKLELVFVLIQWAVATIDAQA